MVKILLIVSDFCRRLGKVRLEEPHASIYLCLVQLSPAEGGRRSA